ncbi:hypothetical protein HPB50_010536 [Hyalomma asiaticum]|uniref:Uncharacterized protein n=1 Tax=Hyalomma asiaticum TaxID=266040 RepID=A0ACB7S6J9_HYAAI|nr:hypothetical protein HPB50_010536 [Hyalomma asiaticum]
MGATGKSRTVFTMSLALLVGLLVLQMTAVLARADPEEVGGNVVEALRLLEHLDKYYSHVNRPRGQPSNAYVDRTIRYPRRSYTEHITHAIRKCCVGIAGSVSATARRLCHSLFVAAPVIIVVLIKWRDSSP